jgi:hypothetical protein
MRVVAGLNFFWHVHPVILRSQPLMRLLGFNGRGIREGTSNRGKKKPPCDEPNETDEKNQPTHIRGPICPDSIASFIQAISGQALERVFNGVVRILAEHSYFPKRINALLDASEIESTERCEGCGKVTKNKPPTLRLRKGRIRKVLETVFGFKIWVVWDPNSRLPLAMRFATIETPETTLAREVVEQAVTNLGGHAEIVSLAVDRGFMDGKFLWWLDKNGIIFYIPAKTDINVYKDALSLAEEGIRQTREKKRGVWKGKNKRTVIDRITMALTTVFRTWMDQQDEREQRGEQTGIRKFREKVKQENGNKLIVFDEDHYAIFDTYEVFILCGRNARKPTGEPEVISKQDILEKYAALRE